MILISHELWLYFVRIIFKNPASRCYGEMTEQTGWEQTRDSTNLTFHHEFRPIRHGVGKTLILKCCSVRSFRHASVMFHVNSCHWSKSRFGYGSTNTRVNKHTTINRRLREAKRRVDDQTFPTVSSVDYRHLWICWGSEKFRCVRPWSVEWDEREYGGELPLFWRLAWLSLLRCCLWGMPETPLCHR